MHAPVAVMAVAKSFQGRREDVSVYCSKHGEDVRCGGGAAGSTAAARAHNTPRSRVILALWTADLMVVDVFVLAFLAGVGNHGVEPLLDLVSFLLPLQAVEGLFFFF